MSDNAAKARRAEELVAEGGVISVQVLNEFANVGRRKMSLGWGELHEIIGTFRDLLDVRELTVAVHRSALNWPSATSSLSMMP